MRRFFKGDEGFKYNQMEYIMVEAFSCAAVPGFLE